MAPQTPQLWRSLGFSGLLPFAFGCLLALLDFHLGSVTPYQFFLAYSTVILAFMAGATWGTALPLQDQDPALIKSNVVALVVFAAILMAPVPVRLGLFAIGFYWIYRVDLKLLSGLDTDPDYLRMRARLTQIVIVMHLFMLGIYLYP